MTINNKSLTFHLFPGDAIGQDESRNEYLQLIREECVDFCPCHLLVDIHQFEFPGDLHVLHMEGCQIAAVMACSVPTRSQMTEKLLTDEQRWKLSSE